MDKAFTSTVVCFCIPFLGLFFPRHTSAPSSLSMTLDLTSPLPGSHLAPPPAPTISSSPSITVDLFLGISFSSIWTIYSEDVPFLPIPSPSSDLSMSCPCALPLSSLALLPLQVPPLPLAPLHFPPQYKAISEARLDPLFDPHPSHVTSSCRRLCSPRCGPCHRSSIRFFLIYINQHWMTLE